MRRLTPGPEGWFYTRRDLEPLSFDDLPLGGEWTTRRRTVSEAEIALFAGVAGDFSPLTIDASRDGRRAAPPAMVVAMAVGLGTLDMPVPAVTEWEWLNWKFPRAVHAGDTIYAHWMLTQKRPPASGAAASIVVWRVDIHTADGALCAEGEVGAKVVRSAVAKRAQDQQQQPPARRRRRRSRSNGAAALEPPAAAAAPPAAAAAPPAAAARPERAAGQSRRRRRRRSPVAPAREGEREPQAAQVPEASTPEPQPQPAVPGSRKGIGGVLRRLRRS